MVNSEFEHFAGESGGGLPALGDESRAVALHYAQEDHTFREVGRAVRSFQRMWFVLFGVCALALYLSLGQVEQSQVTRSLRDVDRIIAALNIEVGQIGLGPSLTYRDLSEFSPSAPIGFNRIGVSDSSSPNAHPSERTNGLGVNPSSAVIGTHLLGRFAVRLALQPTCVLAAFSGAPEKSFNVNWRSEALNSARVPGSAISVIKFNRNCPEEMLAPPLVVINANETYLLGIPHSYNLALSRSMSGAATELPDLGSLRPEPFDPGVALFSNYSDAARNYIPDPQTYDLYDFETAKASLVAWATRVTGRWYSPLDYQLAVHDLLGSGLARQPMFGGDRNYVGLLRGAFVVILALTIAMWRRVRFISRVGIPKLRSWLLVDVADAPGLFVAALYVISVPLMACAVYVAYGEARGALFSSFGHALTSASQLRLAPCVAPAGSVAPSAELLGHFTLCCLRRGSSRPDSVCHEYDGPGFACAASSVAFAPAARELSLSVKWVSGGCRPDAGGHSAHHASSTSSDEMRLSCLDLL